MGSNARVGLPPSPSNSAHFLRGQPGLSPPHWGTIATRPDRHLTTGRTFYTKRSSPSVADNRLPPASNFPLALHGQGFLTNLSETDLTISYNTATVETLLLSSTTRPGYNTFQRQRGLPRLTPFFKQQATRGLEASSQPTKVSPILAPTILASQATSQPASDIMTSLTRFSATQQTLARAKDSYYPSRHSVSKPILAFPEPVGLGLKPSMPTSLPASMSSVVLALAKPLLSSRAGTHLLLPNLLFPADG